MKRNTAFLINGGAGRVMCSIPALELYEQENPDDNFIIIDEDSALTKWFKDKINFSL